MTRLAIVALVSAVCALASCTGTDTGNPPVIDFGNSGCKKSTSSALQSVDKAMPDPRYEGLTCLAWQHVDEQTVKIDLTNYEAGCEADKGWKPQAVVRDDGGLDIILQDDDCSQAKCGWCIYDLSFTVHVDKPLADGEVRVYEAGCKEGAPHVKRATLALSSSSSGAVCNYANRNALFWTARGEVGGRRMPCTTETMAGQEAMSCDQGLVCSDLGESVPVEAANAGARCLLSCTVDADCEELTSCQDGVCKLKVRGLISSY